MTYPRRRTANRHPELADQIRAIIRETAQHDIIGRAIICLPGEIEQRFHPGGNPLWSGHTGKVCYAVKADADEAADRIGQVPGADPVTSYVCPRGDHWHHVSVERRDASTARAVQRIANASLRAQERQGR